MAAPNYSSQVFRSPAQFIEACAEPLVATRKAAANIALATTYKLAAEGGWEESDDSVWAAVSRSGGPDAPDAFYAITIARTSFFRSLASSLDPATVAPPALEGAMRALAAALDGSGLPTAHLPAVTGPRPLVEPFAVAWTTLRGVRCKEKPLMHVYLTTVTEETLREPTRPGAAGRVIGLARERDLDQIARMCFDFAARGAHSRSMEEATAEAKFLVEGGHLWTSTMDGKLEGIVALTPRSPGVISISKAWTEAESRGTGVAEAIVRAACKNVFANHEMDVKEVCLFVDPANPVAVRVYGRVGFAGLDTGAPGEGTEEWMQIGFEEMSVVEQE